MHKIKTKMMQEQWLQLKVKFLLGYDTKTIIKWGELKFSRGMIKFSAGGAIRSIHP